MNNKKITIRLLVEGKTEENYLKRFKDKHLGNDFIFDIVNMKCGNYSNFITQVEQHRGTEIPVFVIADLDRATDASELKYLRKLCNSIRHVNKYSNIFLTFEKFETFLSAHFEKYINICQKLKIDNCDLKNDKNIYDAIIRNDGSYENTKIHLSKNNICYLKDSFSFPKLDEDKINLKQSGLIYFKSYCELLRTRK
ncbi:TOPRIM nucleotidyl transferase/hydrolase domain-containing protein [Campylobacter sp. MOP51]|uniref:TOPRIM nucleotidyl transferase/hydrolase domain-containing protein n=1 Tax=Campylobacter canis TaxID=3378588 RepID=UPI003C475C2C